MGEEDEVEDEMGVSAEKVGEEFVGMVEVAIGIGMKHVEQAADCASENACNGMKVTPFSDSRDT